MTMEGMSVNLDELNIDDIIAEVKAGVYDKPVEKAPDPQPAKKDPAPVKKEKKAKKEKEPKKKSGWRTFFKVLGCFFIFLLVTVALVATLAYGTMYVLCKGPSPTARNLFVMSVRETSAVGFLANIFFTEEEIAQMQGPEEVEEFVDTDTSLITITKPTESLEEIDQGPQPDAWGLVDEDGDGIILEEVRGEGYSGYMMVVLDPSRVIVGSVPTSYGGRGYTVEEMVQKFDAVAGTNAGGFDDPDGNGNGSIPDTTVVFEGKIYYPMAGIRTGFVGFDDDHIMHVATRITPDEIKEKNIQYGVCFGPVLITNGEPCELTISGVNPRTAIGQRSDGAILLLVIDGRQAISLGATHEDLIDIFLEYGAVNACNLDGGSSSMMWYDGDYVNNCASVIGVRPVPTAILVLKEGVDQNG